jgi:hypothetical protein
MAAHSGFDLHVAYCSLRGAEAAHDPEFGVTVRAMGILFEAVRILLSQNLSLKAGTLCVT